jgi:major membrane immunogen (membrane-anchored lipoprotein)
VNGRAQGTTPVTQQVPGGTYSVVFDNAVLGLRRAATVTVAAGKIKKVHVDFTDGEGKVFIF